MQNFFFDPIFRGMGIRFFFGGGGDPKFSPSSLVAAGVPTISSGSTGSEAPAAGDRNSMEIVPYCTRFD